MKIIKEGNYEKIFKPRRFCCTRCGCEFEADSTEYKPSSQLAEMKDGIISECRCPSCGATVYAYERSTQLN